MKCKNCVYEVRARYSVDANNGEICIDYDSPEPNVRECRRNPPIRIKTKINGVKLDYCGWPTIMEYQRHEPWCGEFEARTTLKTKEFHKRKNKPPADE